MKWADFEWDKEQVEFKEGQYAAWIGEGGLLENIKLFALNVETFKQKKANDRYDNLIRQGELLKQMLLYHKYLGDVDSFAEKLNIQREIKNLQNEYRKGVLKAILGKNIELEKLTGILSGKIDLQRYSIAKDDILKLYASMNALSEVVATLKDSRTSFVKTFLKYGALNRDEKECPMCGYEWDSLEKLKTQIEAQEIKINKLAEESGKELNSATEAFERGFIIPINNILQTFMEENRVDEVFVQGLQAASRKRLELNNIYTELKSEGINLEAYALAADDKNINEQLAALKKSIEQKKHDIDESKFKPYFADIYLKYFGEKDELVKQIDLENINRKKEYLQWQYSLYQSTTLKMKKKEYEEAHSRYQNALKIKEGLNQLRKIYEKSLADHQRRIIGDIEILFHIYSGRIVQDCQEGMGLFISDKNGIRFLEDPKKSHDAIFTMSSGQLAVLIIAFTLTLNKRYSQNKVLFVDDPVQTLDELNISSLVDLLRNEFSDRQIFLSTHEDKMSAFMRYKFQKFGLRTTRLSFKESYLAV